MRSRAPLRLGLAGGGTDVSPYCDLYGGAVLNATISHYAHAELETGRDGACIFRSLDQDACAVFSMKKECVIPPALRLHYGVYQEMIRRYNGGRFIAVDLTTFCEMPAGSGLGSSSTLVVAMIHAFVTFLDLQMDEYAIATLAFHVERVVCNFHGGRQDQFAAAFGGFNLMEFPAGGHAKIHPVCVPEWFKSELEASLVLYYTGTSRQSAEIISDQSEKIRSGAGEALAATHALKEETAWMSACLRSGDLAGMVESMRKGWANKKKLASAVSNARIDMMYEAAMTAGALVGKVSGAGGGGFMMFLVPADARRAVSDTLARFGGTVSSCRFEESGSQAWRVDDQRRRRGEGAGAASTAASKGLTVSS